MNTLNEIDLRYVPTNNGGGSGLRPECLQSLRLRYVICIS